MSGAAESLRRLIAHQGPIPVSRFMAEAMAHPEHGYYVRGEPIGALGDFVTAPEISQMFGELIGLWLVDLWRRVGAPAPVRLVELGPGRGTLLADALRAARVAPDFAAAIRLHLVEINRSLRELQARVLAAHRPRWHARLEEVPAGPILLVANEFLDALPVRQFQRGARGRHERMVVASEDGFEFRLSPESVPPSLAPAAFEETEEGAIVERGPAREALVAELAGRIAEAGCGALLIDYGPETGPPGDTLRAVKAHRPQAVLGEVGAADLSADVDFHALAAAARAAGAAAHGPVRQGDLLRALGIDARAARLAAASDGQGAAGIAEARDRLCEAGGMGRRFKALAITAADGPVPAGFEARAK